MVIILARAEDPCACSVHQYLQSRGTAVLFVEEAALFATLALNWLVLENPAECFLVHRGAQVPWTEVSGVLVRLQGLSRSDPRSRHPEQRYLADEQHAALVGLLNSVEGQVINRPPAGIQWPLLRSNRLPWICGGPITHIPQHGFRLPRMVMTSNEEEARRSYTRFGRSALLGLPSGRARQRWVSGDAGEQEIQRMLARGPLRLVEAPAGQWLQVVTVGRRAFGAAGPGNREWEPDEPQRLPAVPLDAELAGRCAALAQSFGLDFAQLQLLAVDAGGIYCMEISEWPNGERWEAPLHEAIAAALADLLAGKAPSRARSGLRIPYSTLPDTKSGRLNRASGSTAS